MQVVWETLVGDFAALAVFAVPLVGLSFLGSLFGAALGTWFGAGGAKPQARRAVLRGLLAGSILTIVLGMLLEFALAAEGYSAGRQALREQSTRALWLFALCIAMVTALITARAKPVPADDSVMHGRRRFTLRQLFAVQLGLALFLAWWGFTRRHEFRERQIDVNWRARDSAAKSAFESHGWIVSTLRDRDDVMLHFPMFRRPLIGDEALRPVPHYERVTRIAIISDKVTDEGLKALAACPDLVYLQIGSNRVTDAGLAVLAESSSLRHLGVNCPEVTATGLRGLAGSKSLAFVRVVDAKANKDEVVEMAESLPHIEWSIYQGGKLLTPQRDRQ